VNESVICAVLIMTRFTTIDEFVFCKSTFSSIHYLESMAPK